MLIQRKTLNGKVARRIFGLFIVSALLPITIMAALSFFQVNAVISRQSEEQLRHQSKNYGMSILARLNYARAQLQFTSTHPDSMSTWRTHDDSISHPMFHAITLRDADGHSNALLGRVIDDAALLDNVQQSPDTRLFLLEDHTDRATSPDTRPGLYLRLMSNPMTRDSSMLLAELNPGYLWGSSELLPLMTEICVLTRAGTIVFCSRELPQSLFQSQPLNRHSGVLRWNRNEEEYLGVYRELFLENQFAYPALIIFTYQPADYALAPLSVFTRLFPAVLVLALCVVVLLSLSQIRRSLIPLEKLKAGTHDIANHSFSHRVEVDRDDEFGDLARAFNGMASRLGRQFQALNTLARVDQLLLTNPNSQDAARIVLEHMPDIVPCDSACIAIFEASPASVFVYSRQYSDQAQTVLAQLALGPTAIQAIQAASKPFFVEIEKSTTAETYLQPLIDHGAGFCWLTTIRQHTRLVGFIALGYRRYVRLQPDDLSQLGDVAGRIAVVSSAWQREQKLYRQAHYDALTELPNRYFFNKVLEREIAQCQQDDTLLAMMFIDLDHFKDINDTLGHNAGDELLRQVAGRLEDCLRPTDTVARIGGDEFNLILPKLGLPIDASKTASRILGVLAEVFHIENEEHYISASIGIALYPYDGVTSEELMRHADTAMYRAKQDGRGRYRFFEEEMNISINKRLQLERDLRQALKQRQFRLHFQPMLDLNNNMINGAEALLHWQHPEQGIIAAHQFVPMAEEAGLMEDIGQWSVQQTLDYYLSWQKRGLTLQHIAINLSNRQFQSPESLAMIESLLKSTRIPPRRLELELNEDLFMQDDHTVESHFRRLHQLGVQLSINNFGTGRASLHYLKQLPVDILKIDKSFLRQVPDDRHSVALLESIIAMAKKLQKQIIIVGIENTAQLEFIRRNHCNRIQGHHLSPALSADEFLVFVQRYNHCNSDKSAVAKLA